MDIEKYLKTNRLKLDTEAPDDEIIWNGIKKGLVRNQKTSSGWFWKIAAVFLFGVLLSYIFVKENQKEQVIIITLADVSKELGIQETELKQIVNKKWEEINLIPEEEKLQFKFLFDELNELDKVYKTYENDLFTTDENEQIIAVLLDYYEKKIRILNRLSLEIKKQKNNKSNRNLSPL